ncbi:uncharacterized protein RBU33_021665 [Hipposideros larvatus]
MAHGLHRAFFQLGISPLRWSLIGTSDLTFSSQENSKQGVIMRDQTWQVQQLKQAQEVLEQQVHALEKALEGQISRMRRRSSGRHLMSGDRLSMRPRSKALDCLSKSWELSGLGRPSLCRRLSLTRSRPVCAQRR